MTWNLLQSSRNKGMWHGTYVTVKKESSLMWNVRKRQDKISKSYLLTGQERLSIISRTIVMYVPRAILMLLIQVLCFLYLAKSYASRPKLMLLILYLCICLVINMKYVDCLVFPIILYYDPVNFQRWPGDSLFVLQLSLLNKNHN